MSKRPPERERGKLNITMDDELRKNCIQNKSIN